MTSGSSPQALPQGGTRALETLVCYRSSVPAELARRSAPTLALDAGSPLRALAALEALQADARERPARRRSDPPRHDQTNPRNRCSIMT